jgi:hypothetical protein
MPTIRSTVQIASLCLLVLPACADEGPGSLIIPVRLGNNKTCDEVEVTQLRASLDDGEYVEEAECEEDEVRMGGIAAGEYDLTVQGLAKDGIAIMDNLADGPFEVRVIGDGATVTVDEQQLLDAPARLLVRWDFMFTQCTDANIEEFDVSAYETGGTALLLRSTLECLAPADEADGYHTVPDPDRELKGGLVGEAELSWGPDADQRVSYVFEPPGAGRAVRLGLVCDASGCVEE